MVVSTVDCLSCGAGNPAESKFCSDCGTPVSVERSCPACDAMSPAAADLRGLRVQFSRTGQAIQ